ncbi:hypothetical protein SAMN05216215_1028101 [Saccharopolyspora shandongensis]|uniref:Uncharacterized protein n=1 Tax=Saccharopolyspora shandongensis TaxID=418495 RepID=A0A1H3KMC2_9PSEU|nr:hypothetical protein [Saccharopolyspora shandongensis]SDY53323.1 hypothetical protein SAMN05216215_1028101 [Saccharopolyspora shandongensis]
MTATPRIALPGLMIGAVSALFAGGLALIGGMPASWAAVTAVALGLPLAAFGTGCSALREHGVLRGGTFAPVALYWMIAFPAARLVQDVGTRLILDERLDWPPHPLAFLAYQALISVGFAIGFVWVHERL